MHYNTLDTAGDRVAKFITKNGWKFMINQAMYVIGTNQASK